MGITGGSPLALEGCVYAVDVLPVCPSQELSCWGPSLNHNSFVLQPQYQQWVLDLLMAKYPGRCGGPRTMCLGRIELEKDRGDCDPLVIVINHLWRILSQSSSHITKTLSSDLPKWSILLYGNGHCPCLYPQWLSNTYILHGSPTNAESLVWIDIKQICYCKQRSLGPCTYPGRAVPVYPAPTKIIKFSLYPVSSTFI